MKRAGIGPQKLLKRNAEQHSQRTCCSQRKKTTEALVCKNELEKKTRMNENHFTTRSVTYVCRPKKEERVSAAGSLLPGGRFKLLAAGFLRGSHDPTNCPLYCLFLEFAFLCRVSGSPTEWLDRFRKIRTKQGDPFRA